MGNKATKGKDTSAESEHDVYEVCDGEEGSEVSEVEMDPEAEMEEPKEQENGGGKTHRKSQKKKTDGQKGKGKGKKTDATHTSSPRVGARRNRRNSLPSGKRAESTAPAKVTTRQNRKRPAPEQPAQNAVQPSEDVPPQAESVAPAKWAARQNRQRPALEQPAQNAVQPSEDVPPQVESVVPAKWAAQQNRQRPAPEQPAQNAVQPSEDVPPQAESVAPAKWAARQNRQRPALEQPAQNALQPSEDVPPQVESVAPVKCTTRQNHHEVALPEPERPVQNTMQLEDAQRQSTAQVAQVRHTAPAVQAQGIAPIDAPCRTKHRTREVNSTMGPSPILKGALGQTLTPQIGGKRMRNPSQGRATAKNRISEMRQNGKGRPARTHGRGTVGQAAPAQVGTNTGHPAKSLCLGRAAPTSRLIIAGTPPQMVGKGPLAVGPASEPVHPALVKGAGGASQAAGKGLDKVTRRKEKTAAARTYGADAAPAAYPHLDPMFVKAWHEATKTTALPPNSAAWGSPAQQQPLR